MLVYSDGPSTLIPFRDMFQQMQDWVEPMVQFTKWRWQVEDARHISEIARRAYKLARTPPGGPVHIRIPQNVLGERGVKDTVYPQRRFTIPVEMRPKPDLVEQTAKALLNAKQPMITAGSEVTRAGARDELVELAELLGIPVAQGYSVFGDFPWRHPLWSGFHALGPPKSLSGTDVFVNLGVPDAGARYLHVAAAAFGDYCRGTSRLPEHRHDISDGYRDRRRHQGNDCRSDRRDQGYGQCRAAEENQ